MKNIYLSAALSSLIILFISPAVLKAGNGQMMFVAVMTSFDEVPQVIGDGNGLMTFLFSEDRKQVSVHGVFTNLSGPATACHIHLGVVDSSGPVLVDLSAFISGNRIKGTFQVPAGNFIDNAVYHQLYFNIHTAAHPNGEIRGQLELKTEIILPVLASAKDEIPAITTNAVGLGALRFSQNMTRMEYRFLAVGLSGPVIAAHIHSGHATENGSVLAPLNVNTGDLITGTIIDDILVNEILFEAYLDSAYLNVHTAAHPNGEIRGQLIEDWPINGSTLLTGDQETPAVNSTAKAYGYASLDLPNLDSITYIVVYSGIVPSAAHIHNGTAGVAGPVIIPLKAANFPGAYFGRAAIKDVDVTSFLKDDLYFNIHSTAHPTGEIRGQIQNNLLKSFAFDLCGGQEAPAKKVGGYGAGFVAVNKSNTELNYGLIVHGLTGDATQAHIHDGVFGSSGPVVLGLETPLPYSVNVFDITGVPGINIDIDGAYMNVHTDANPNGEIRGQIRRTLSCNFDVATVQSAIQEISLSNTLARDLLILKADSDKNVQASIYVSDISGKPMMQWQNTYFVAGNNKISFNVDRLSSGFYILNLVDENNSIRSFKFVKQ